MDDGEYEDEDTEEDDEEEYDEPSRKRKKNGLIANIYIQASFKYINCTLPLSLFVCKSKEMDTEKFICKKCSFTTEKLEKLNTHTKRFTLFIMCLMSLTRSQDPHHGMDFTR